jgi:hypothetical protein
MRKPEVESLANTFGTHTHTHKHTHTHTQPTRLVLLKPAVGSDGMHKARVVHVAVEAFHRERERHACDCVGGNVRGLPCCYGEKRGRAEARN